MSVVRRQVFVIVAISAFFIGAPLLLLHTAGYTWAGIRHGWQRTGLIAVTAEPAAMLSLNGRNIGRTPQRVERLIPGTYAVTLRAPGKQDWTISVRVEPGQVKVIGPVKLFAPDWQTTPLAIGQPGDHYFSDGRGGVALAHPSGNLWTIRPAWPNSGPEQTVDTRPDAVAVSDDRQAMAVTNDASTTFSVTGQPTFQVEPLDRIFWSNQSDAIAFGFRRGHLWRVDMLARETVDWGAATSAAYANGAVWMTTANGANTDITSRPPVGTSQTATTALEGPWEFLSTAVPVLHNSDTRVFGRWFPSDRTLNPIGHADRLWWDNGDQPPLWENGADLQTLDARGNPSLIDRGNTQYAWLDWIEPRHLLAMFDGTTLSMRGTSDRQGQDTILRVDLPAGSRVITINRDQRFILVLLGSGERRLVEYHW